MHITELLIIWIEINAQFLKCAFVVVIRIRSWIWPIVEINIFNKYAVMLLAEKTLKNKLKY